MPEDHDVVRGRFWRDGELVDRDIRFEEIASHLEEGDSLTWVDVCDPEHRTLQRLAEELDLEPHAVEDAVSLAERAKATRYASHMFLTLYAVSLPEPAGVARPDGQLSVDKVSAFVLPRGLITVRATPDFDIQQVVQRWDDNPRLLTFGVGGLLHGLLDTIVDGHFDAVQALDDAMEDLEEGVFDENAASGDVQRATFHVRKNLVALRRVVLPMRDVVSTVLRHNVDFDSVTGLGPSYDDLYDHVLRAADWTESLRDMVGTIYETSLSLQDTRLNNVMKSLTAWAAIIAVPTAVTGYFGQNVPYPGFQKEWGFLLSAAIILVLAMSLFVGFRRRNWI